MKTTTASCAAMLLAASATSNAQPATPASDRLTPSTADRMDQAGFDIAAAGDWVFVASPSDNVGGFFNTGSITPFFFDDAIGTWVETPLVTSIGLYPNQYFGLAIAADEDTLVIGSPQDTRYAIGGGAVEVFTRSGDQWVFDHEVFPLTPYERGDLFGSSVAIAGDLLVVGTPSADSRGPSSGRATIFERAGSTFEPILDIERGDEDDLYGWSVAAGDGFVAVGTFNIGGSTFSFAGRGIVDVYEDTGDDWILVATLEQDVPTDNERFGWSMDAAGGVIAVGAYNEGSIETLFSGPGAVYIYEKVAGEWTRTARLEAPDTQDYQQFGYDVDLSPDGTMLLVGAESEPEAGEDAGAIYAYERDGDAWRFARKIVSPFAGPDAELAHFGTSVAVTTTTAGETWLVGGAPESDVEGFRAGDVYASPLDGSCTADCNGSGSLDIFDFLCFQGLFQDGELRADCDGSGALDIFDFLCFQTSFDAGCP